MGTTGKGTFPLLFGCHEIPIPIGKLDHLHAKGCSQLLLGSLKHPFELAALRPKDWESERVSLTPMPQWWGGRTLLLNAVPPDRRPRVFTSQCVPHHLLDELACGIPLAAAHGLVAIFVDVGLVLVIVVGFFSGLVVLLSAQVSRFRVDLRISSLSSESRGRSTCCRRR